MSEYGQQDELTVGSIGFGLTPQQLVRFLQPNACLAPGAEVLLCLPQRAVNELCALTLEPADFVTNALHCYTDGSFMPQSAREGARCAWACVFICPLTLDWAVISGTVPSWVFELGEQPSAFVGECCAIVVASWISVTTFHHRAVTLQSDCQSAIGVFEGVHSVLLGGLAATLRGMGIFARAFAPDPPKCTYVPGHVGSLGNELADRVAKAAIRHRSCGQITWKHPGNADWWHTGGDGVVFWLPVCEALRPIRASGLRSQRVMTVSAWTVANLCSRSSPLKDQVPVRTDPGGLCPSVPVPSMFYPSTTQPSKAIPRTVLPSNRRDLRFWRLCLKVGVTCAEPAGFKGSILAKLYKGRGDKTQCGNYRAIMLLSTLAKLLHKSFRPSLYDVFAANDLPTQLGGRKSTSVVLGAHLTRAFGRFCASAGCSAVTLFTDVASAYYTAVRALTAVRGSLDEAHGAGLTEQQSSTLLSEELAQPTAMRQAQATPWVEALTAELNSHTWMYLAGDTQPIVTRRGSRPGSSFADLFYGVTVPRILRWRDDARAQADAALRWVAPQTIVHWDGVRDFSPPFESPSALVCATPLEDIIWADDLAKCIMVPSADLAAKVAAMECGLLADAFFAHGYTLSFGPAKTAVMLARARGCRYAYR